MGLKIIQANIQHKRAAAANLARKFKAEGLDIALIQEPWVVNGRVAGLADSGGKLLYATGEKVPRTCLLVSNKVTSLLMVKFCFRDLVAAVIKRGTQEIIIGTAYFPYDSTNPPPTEEVVNLISEAKRKGSHLILGCDANAHHTTWGSTDCNSRGEFLLDYIYSQNLVVANQGQYPTFITAVRKEVLDITLCTQHIARSIRNWQVLREPSLADHQHIAFTVDAEEPSVERYRNPRRTNWTEFREDLGTILGPEAQPIRTQEELETAADSIQAAIIHSYEKNCIPSTKTSSRKTWWWNDELQALRVRVRKQFKTSMKYNQWDAYRTLLTTYSKEIRKAKRASWRKYCEEVEHTSDAARLYRSLKASHQNPVGTIEREDGSHTETGRETLEILLASHFPDSVAAPTEARPDGQQWKARRGDWNCAKRLIEPNHVRWAINSFDAIKAPGPDGILPLLLQEGEDVLVPHLVAVFQASLALGHVPKAWASAKVVFIPKPGRPDYGQAKAYRPICLTSFILKAMEKILDKYIRRIVQDNNAMHPNQFAYRPGKSTEAALHQLVSRVEESLEAKEIALAAFLDVEGAFSNTSYQSMVNAIEEAGVSKTVCRWVSSMLEGRRVTATLFEETVELRATRGCAQGGVLSPLLWNLVVNKLLEILFGRGVYVQGYADDIVILIIGKFAEAILDRMQQILKLVEAWCRQENLKVNPGKTTLLPFTRRRGVEGWRELQLFGEHIKMANEVKYLGVTLDRRLTWNAHMEKTIIRAKNCMHACRRVVGKNWGITPKTTHWIYTGIVRPMISYASVVWWPKVAQTTVEAKLEGVQRLAGLGITGAMSSTPTDSINVVLNLPPLSLFIKGQARMSAYRLEQAGIWKPKYDYLGHCSITRVVADRTLSMPSDHMIPTFCFTKTFETHIVKRDEWEIDLWQPNEEDPVWYTDGSKTDSGTGAGINGVNPEKAISICMGKFSTVFQTEVCAIAECLQENLNLNYVGKTIHIFTDSQAAIKALEAFKTSSKLVWECKQRLLKLSRNNQVKLIWVPGHIGVDGNEKADELARSASEQALIGPEPACGISYGHARTLVNNWVREKTNQYWKKAPDTRLAKAFLSGPSKKITEKLLHMARPLIRVIVGLLTGHCHLRKHLHRIGVYDGSILCRKCGGAVETAEHVILDCDALARCRYQTLGPPGTELDNIRQDPISTIGKFIRMANLFEE